MKKDLALYIRNNYGTKPNEELRKDIFKEFGIDLTAEAIRKRWQRGRKQEDYMKSSPKDQVAKDIESSHSKSEKRTLDKKYRVALNTIGKLETALHAYEKVKPISEYRIVNKEGKKSREAVAVVLLSDTHVEEIVKPQEVNGRNEHNLAISKVRMEEFFQGALRLTEICGRDVQINTMVLAFLGDFITNDIHDEMPEICELLPADAIIECQNRLASGIRFLLDNSKLNLIIPCHSGNHARTTEYTRNATEAGHSYEYLMYHFLADHFKNEKRVKFLISRSYHSYLDVLGLTIRFHHGHNIRYGGGVGGLTIPVNKAIAQWNKLRWADLDCFGHFHQMFDGGNFIANGSMIGYNAFALSIKAGFEKPAQTFFLIDSKRGRTCRWNLTFNK